MGSKIRRSQRRCRHSDDQVLDLGKTLATTVANLSISDAHGLCEDLISGLLAAEECKKYINEGEAEEACVYFVKACSYSVHSIQSLQNCFPKFIQLLDAVELQLSQYYKVTGKPAILQATELILFGYNIRKLADSTAESLHLLTLEIRAGCPVESPHGLDRADMIWVYHLGCFKTALHMIAQSLLEEDKDFCWKLLVHSLDSMHAERPLHPTVFEASNLYYQLKAAHSPGLQQLGASELAHDPDLTRLQHFVNCSLQSIKDPAAVMHLLLQSMYIILKNCKAQLDARTLEFVLLTADLWHELYVALRDIYGEPFGDLWYKVKDRMQAAMLLLGRSFPLQHCLKGHILVDIIEDTFQVCSAEFQTQRAQEQVDLQTTNTEADVRDGRAHCAKCKKHLWQEKGITFHAEKVRLWLAKNDVCKPLPCKCGAVVYCNPNCMQLDKADHRAHCKRHQLKNKLARR